MSKDKHLKPGPVALFGSGETAPNGRKVFQALMERLPHSPAISLLETPAGFELNSPQVAGNVAQFLEHHLQNFNPQTTLIPARKRGTSFSPQDPSLLEPILSSDVIFMGPGSPSYAIRQLQDSLAWEYVLARHRLGAGLALASASAIAVSTFAIPVYEIYKVGEDIHWLEGLDLFGPFNLALIFVPHWNNNEGGDNLDTSRCFMGQARFQPMMEMLPEAQTIVGMDEHTGLIIDPGRKTCDVIGLDRVTLIQGEDQKSFSAGETFSIHELGNFKLPSGQEEISSDTWDLAREKEAQLENSAPEPGKEVRELLEKRRSARQKEEWDTSDRLREKIHRLGWIVRDTPEGQVVVKKD